MTSNVEIANRALTKIGTRTIVSLDEDSNSARAINAIFEGVRRTEIRKNPWSFAKKRAQLAADAEEPLFDYGYQFTFPSDSLRVLKPKENVDWVIEGKKIMSDDSGPIDIVYIRDVTDPNEFDEAFVEAFACKLALDVCERLTQSESKRERCAAEYRAALMEARRINAIERMSQGRIEDDWELARY